MATYLSVPLKKTWEIDLVNPLRTFISDTFTNADPENYNQALTEFNKLRNTMISKSVDKHESALEVLYRYYDQLVVIDSKFPVSENQIRINFRWQDAFDKESFFSGKRTLTVASASYEKVCLLFNIAALQSQIAECQNHTSDEGLKLSAKLFQQASGIFNYLKDCVLSHIQNDPTPDLHPDALNGLAALMLAQAQDCFCRKAIQDKMKPAITAKLCHQCSDLYADSMKLLQLESIRTLWPKDWISSVAGKQAAFHAMAEYNQSLVCKENKDFGEEIARLQHAKDLILAAENRGSYTFIFQEQSRKIQRTLEDAKKDNNFIYHAKVPEQNAIASIGKAGIAKPTPLPSSMSSNFKDLFEKVVPLAVHQSLVAFENRKAQKVNMEVGRLREATQLLNGVLASMNLPAAIEDLTGSKVPQSLLDKAAQLRENGGSEHLMQLVTQLPELLTRNKDILEEAERMLREEEESDQQLRKQFKEKWTRTPSEKLTEPIKAESSKYRQIIDNAISADGIVQQRYGTHKEGILILSKSNAEIEKSLPSGSPVASLQGKPVVAELRKLIDETESIKAEREVMEKELKEANCDMTAKFMEALAQDGAISEDTLSDVELEKIYGPLTAQVSDSIHRQETNLQNIQRLNGEFCQAKAHNTSGAQREQKLKELAAAFDSFMELKSNLEEGTKFYNDLTQLLVKFQNKVNDFCFARKTEKEDLMKDLQSNIARQPSAAPPATPTYQQPTVSGSSGDSQKPVPAPRKAPTRPPPPAATSAQPASQQPPTAPAGQGAAPYGGYPQTPYPVYPPTGAYMPPPMPQGYNPYGGFGGYGYPPQGQPPAAQPRYPMQGYPAYPPQGYPQQQPPRW